MSYIGSLDYHTDFFQKCPLNIIQLCFRILCKYPEVMWDDHLRHDPGTSEQHGHVAVHAVAESQNEQIRFELKLKDNSFGQEQ